MPKLDTSVFVKPRVVGERKKADVYIIGEAPGEEEQRQGLTYVGRSGQILDAILKEAGIDSARLFNVVPYRPENNETPTDEQIEEYKEFVLNDIEIYRPKVIVCTGKTPAKAIIGLSGSISSARGMEFKYKDIPVIVTWHPSFILRNGGFGSQRCRESIEDFIQCKKFLKNGEEKEDEDEFETIVLDYRNGPEVAYTLAKVFEQDQTIVLDYETSSLDVLFEDFKLSLIGLYSPTSNKAVLVRFEAPDQTGDTSAPIPTKTSEAIKKLFKNKTLVVFNMTHELLTTYSIFGFVPPNFVDVAALAKCKGYGSVSLKDLSAKVTKKALFWKKEIDEFVEISTKIINLSSVCNKEAELLQDCLDNRNFRNFNLFFQQEHKKKTVQNLCSSVLDFMSLCSRLQIEKEVMFIVLRRLLSGNKRPFVYTDIPHSILVKYCATDVFQTWKVYKALWNEEDRKAFEIYNDQAYLSAYMTGCGIAWDVGKSYQIESLFKTEMDKTLRKFLLSPRLSFLLEKKGISRETVETMPVEKMTEIFNPTGVGEETRNVLNAAIVSGRVKLALALHRLTEISEENEMNQYRNLISILKQVMDSENRIEKIDYICKNIKEVLGPIKLLKKEKDLLSECLAFKISDTRAETFETLFSAMKNIFNIDVDDESKWIPEFEVLFLYKLYKKIHKSISAFIEGKVGRKSVAVVDAVSERNSIFPRRLRWLDSRDFTTDKSNIYIQVPEWNANSADTKRWRSAIHTIPWNSNLVELRISRFPDGIRIHADYSQMEIRVLAAMSGEQALLKAFEEGIDVHRFCASKVFKKDPKDVTDSERRFAKMVTFSILYGQSVSGLAMQHLKGDMELSRQLFDSVFESFPKIREFIRKKHRELLDNGYVTTLFGDVIKIDLAIFVDALTEEEKESIVNGKTNEDMNLIMKYPKKTLDSIQASLRAAQNYPIQSTASSLSALAMTRIVRRLTDMGINPYPDCFTHDSLDFDQRIVDLPKILPVFIEEANGYPLREWSVPVKADFEIGIDGMNTISIEDVEGDGESETSFSFEGPSRALAKISDTIASSAAGRVSFEVTVEKTKKVKQSRSEIFAGKRSFSLDIGKEIEYVSGKATLRLLR